jgi:chorismate mutase / prephenate dehydrogenase
LSAIETIRTRVDHIDREIVHLLKSRYEQARLLGEIKRVKGLSLRDQRRERQVLRRVEDMARDQGLPARDVKEVFAHIFELSLRVQQPLPHRSTLDLDEMRVLVAGGTGGMGLFFAQLARSHGAHVSIFGRSRDRTRKIANDFGFAPGSIRDSHDSDWVIVAVPMEATVDMCSRLGKHLRRESILTDITSVKSGISDKIARLPHSGWEYVSLHPLFGPQLSHIYGQDIIQVPYRARDQWSLLAEFFESEGAHLHQTSAETHDRVMAYLQGLHHFGLTCIGLSLRNWDGQYSTNSLQRTVGTLQSLVESWHTIAGIQKHNPYCQGARNEFRLLVGRLWETGIPNQPTGVRALEANVQKWSRKQ